MELLVAAVSVLIAVGILLVANRGRRGHSRNDAPWWTLGLFALTSRSEEEAREEQIDALLVGEAADAAVAPPDDHDGASDDHVGGNDESGGDGGSDGGSDD